MFKILAFALLAYLIFRGVRFYLRLKSFFLFQKPAEEHQHGTEELCEDPQCHTFVLPSQAHQQLIKGRKYFFCSRQCAKDFAEAQK